MHPFRLSNLKRAFVGVLFLLSLSINVLQAFRIYALQLDNAGLSTKGALTVGESVPALDVIDLQGTRARIQYEQTQPTVLYVFSPSCAWCMRNANAVNSFSKQIKGTIRFVGI